MNKSLKLLGEPYSVLVSLIIGMLVVSLALWWWQSAANSWLLIKAQGQSNDYQSTLEWLFGSPQSLWGYMKENADQLVTSWLRSASTVLLALVIGGPIGWFMGVLSVVYLRSLHYLVATVVIFIYALPGLAQLLLLFVWLRGRTETMYIYLIWDAFTFFLIIGWWRAKAVVDGTASDSTSAMSMVANVYFSKRHTLFLWYVLPRCTEPLWLACSVATLVLWHGLIFAESVVAWPGIGYNIYRYGYESIYKAPIFITNVLIMCLSSLVMWAMFVGLRQVLPYLHRWWHYHRLPK